MDLVDDEFDALVEDLIASLDKFKVPAKEKGELTGALGPLEPSMVVPADRLKPVSDAELAKATAIQKSITDKNATAIYAAALVALKRGQRNYAEQLFSRVEFISGAKKVASVASVFRAGAPPRIATPTKKMPLDTPAQPKVVGSSDEDSPEKVPGKSSLKGTMTVEGKPLTGIGTVMLFPAKGGKKRTPKTRIVEQRNKTFMPRVLAVPVGSTVQFPNFDGIYHNVFSISAPKKFDVGLYKDGETREVKVDKAGVIRLGCNIHAKMASYILVVDAPHYVVVGGDKFNFEPAPGKYVRGVGRSAAPAEGGRDQGRREHPGVRRQGWRRGGPERRQVRHDPPADDRARARAEEVRSYGRGSQSSERTRSTSSSAVNGLLRNAVPASLVRMSRG
jgi:plastocyanin